MKKTILFLAVLTLIVNLRAAEQELRKAIEAAEQKFVAAFNEQDVDALAQMFMADAQSLPQDSKIVKGRQAIKERFESFFKGSEKREQKATTIDVVGQGEFATEIGLWTEKTESGSLIEEGTYIVVWKKQGDDWKIYRDTWNRTSQKLKLIEPLEGFEKLLGSWTLEDADVRVSLSYKAAGGGSGVAYEGSARMGGEIDEWSGVIYYRPESKTIVDTGASTKGWHGLATVHLVDDKMVFQHTGYNEEGEPESGVDELTVDGDTLTYTQVSRFANGKEKDELIRGAMLKREI